MNSIPWNRLPFAIAPNLPLTPRTEWRGGGRLYKWDILPVSRAASLASQHAGKEITPADFFEAAARGEIILRAPAHRSARIKNLVGAGLLEIDGKALADTIEKEQVLYLPMATCRRLAQTGRASWRDIVMYKPLAPEHGSFVPMQYTLAKLVDGEPDFEAVAEDCFVSVEGMHALADDVLLDVQAAASASESDAPESGEVPAKRPPQAQALPKTMQGVTKAEITGIDWPLVAQRNCASLERALGDVSETRCKWLLFARISKGTSGKGGGSHLWNPAKLAFCLCSHNWIVNKAKLQQKLEEHFSDYLDEWEELKEKLG